MAGAYAALVSVMNVTNNLELHPYPPITLHPKQAEFLTQHLTFFEEFLQGYDQNLAYSTEADPLESRIAAAVHAAEDAIESHIAVRYEKGLNSSGGNAIGSHIADRYEKGLNSSGGEGNKSSLYKKIKKAIQKLFFQKDATGSHVARRITGSDASLYEALEKVIQETELIQKEAIAIKQTMAVGVQHQLHPKSTPTPMDSLRSSSVAEKTTMVGADNLLDRMKDKVVSDRRDRQIISVVGMGGSGKTTLAINIYQDPLIKEHFHIRAWATISQEYSIREILAGVLCELKIEAAKHLSKEELGEKLYRHLCGRRYLIVIDDMWSIGAWDEIKRFFPDNENGSRIVVTTRLSNLASDLPNFSSLEMKLLDETSSWDLLSKTVFKEEGCPRELEEIGKEIGKSCKGLPLSIVVVGGFLAKSERTRECWKPIEENLSIIGNLADYESSLKILHMSYKQLPIYLKPCFLYLGIFPEDDVIRVSELVKLWVAEGFLKPTNGESSLEEIGRVYLKDLADRNLVLTDEMGITGNIRRCKIHDLVRELCLREAEKERFYTRRIVISKNEDINALSSMSAPVRSLIWDKKEVLHYLTWDLKEEEVAPLNLRLLRILYLRRPVKVDAEFLENVYLKFVNSRFLQLSASGEFSLRFPISIFWNLQTLNVGGSLWLAVNAPTDIWYMPHIRHLLFPFGIHLPDPPEDEAGIVLGNLQTLARATNFKCSDQVVKRIPNIKKLKANYESLGSLDEHYYLTNLGHLEKLESLHLGTYRRGSVSLQNQINFPHSLKKLWLYIEYWEQELLDKIGLLPFLQKLTLTYGRFKDGQWETTEGQFRSLKFLHLLSCENLQVWTIESSRFPCLTNLRLSWLRNLEEIPLEFAQVSTLGVIEVRNCSDSAVVSAKRILEEYEEFHGEGHLQVQVSLWYTNKVEPESLRTPNFLFV